MTDVAIEDVLDGKLGVRIEMGEGWLKTASAGGNSFGFESEDMNQLRNEMEAKYFNMDQMAALVSNINTRLTRNWAFVLPGGGSFLKNLVLTDEHDLVVDLTYNGVQRRAF